MTRRQRLFCAHMAVAGGALVLGMVAGARHMPWVAFINAGIFGANLMGAWKAKP